MRLGVRYIRILIRTQLWAQILVAMILGLATGLFLSPHGGGLIDAETAAAVAEWLQLPGVIFLNLIQMVVIPLITASIILGIASAGDPGFLRRVAIRIVPYFVGTTIIAVLIGITLVQLIEPGLLIDTNMAQLAAVSEGLPDAEIITEQLSLPERIASVIPSNIAEAQLYQNMLQIVMAAIFSGVAIMTLGSRANPLVTLLQLVREIALKIVGWAMLLAPLAVFGLTADTAIRVGLSALVGLSAYMGTVFLGLCLLLTFYFVIVSVVGGLNPLVFIRSVAGAQLLAFSTSSSAATMPLSLKVAQEKLDISPPVAQFIVPIGATVNMDGTALYQVIATLFVAQIYGVSLDPTALALLVATIVGASIGSPSAPGVGIAILATILLSIGIPVGGIAIILGVDRLLDMCRTAVNVTGDLTACVVMNRWLASSFEMSPTTAKT